MGLFGVIAGICLRVGGWGVRMGLGLGGRSKVCSLGSLVFGLL